MIDKRKVLLGGVLLTVINYLIAYILSSREVLIDYKNISLILLFSLFWAVFFVKKPSSNYIPVLYCISVIIGFIVPYIAFLQEPLFLQRLMKDFLYWYSLPLVLILLPALGLKEEIYRYFSMLC